MSKQKKEEKRFIPVISNNNDPIDEQAHQVDSVSSTEIETVDKSELTIINKFRVTALENLARVKAAEAQLSAQVEIFSKQLTAAKKVQSDKIENALIKIIAELNAERAEIFRIHGIKANDDKMKALEAAAEKLGEQIQRIEKMDFDKIMPGMQKRLIEAAYNLFNQLFGDILSESSSLLDTLEQHDLENRRIQKK